MVAGTEKAFGFRIPLARYARREEILYAGIPLVLSAALLAAWGAGAPAILGVIGLLGTAASVAVASFFRDPARMAPPGEERVVSPADGKVVAIREVEGDPFIGERGIEIDIFLSIFDVHVNRSPIAGVVDGTEYEAGAYLSALRAEAGQRNERNTVRIRGESARAVVRQIAGAIARRIVCACRPGEGLRRGERFGMIKFGSRTQVILPGSIFQPAVRVGDRVKAGSSVIGTLRKGESS